MTLQDTEIKCLMLTWFSYQPPERVCSRTWTSSTIKSDMGTNSLKMTRILIFQNRSSSLKNNFTYGNINIAHKKLHIMRPKHQFHCTFDLREKGRRAFYVIKRKISIDFTIRTWLKILDKIIDPPMLYSKWSMGCTYQPWPPKMGALHAELCKN